MACFLVLCEACATAAPANDAPAAAARPGLGAAELDGACGKMGEVRERALAAATEAERLAVERWSAGRDAAPPDRDVMAALARRYVDECGLGEVIELTEQLVSFPTVSAEHSPADGEPFADMARFLEERARGSGLGFASIGKNDVWEITLGRGARSVAFVMHADVVPAGAPSPSGLPQGWSQPPFAATVVGDRFYGRGTEDDKGAIAAAIVGLETMRRFGLAPRGQIVIAMGTGEEHDWSGMEAYAAKGAPATHVISVDAGFPVVFGESGFVAWELATPLGATEPDAAKPCAVDVRAGEFLTQVPGEAELHLAPARGQKLAELTAIVRRHVEAAQRRYRQAELPFDFEVAADESAQRCVVKARGVAVHSSIADEGHNAMWALASVARELDLAANGVRAMLGVVARFFDGDLWGERLGLAYEHAVMGKLIVAPTVLRSEKDEVRLAINMRRPEGLSAEEFSARLDAATARVREAAGVAIRETDERWVGKPALASARGELVTTLMAIYREVTGDAVNGPMTIRGGTYARLFPGAVNFGPSLPGRPYRGHAPDEYIELEALRLMTRMLFEAALRLDEKATPMGASAQPAGR